VIELLQWRQKGHTSQVKLKESGQPVFEKEMLTRLEEKF